MAQLKTTGQDWWFCAYLISMNYYNESKKFSLKCVKTGNSIEFEGSRNGNLVEGILTKGLYSNWIAFPALRVSCELSNFSDLFWNREQLENIIENDFDVETILLVINELKLLFDQDSQSYFDGQKFMSQREYIFWLENQCEILSIQMLKLKMKLESFIDENLEEELDDERNQYHNTMRFQYEDTIFE